MEGSSRNGEQDVERLDLLLFLIRVLSLVPAMFRAPAELSAGGQGRGDRPAPLVLLAAFGGSQRSQE